MKIAEIDLRYAAGLFEDDRLVMKSYNRAKGIEVYDTKQDKCFYLQMSTD